MNDLISKATFGFVMAQFFPGAIAIFAIGFAYFALEPGQPITVLRAASRVLGVWSSAPVAQQLFLVGLCIGAGMLIHGINWAILGAVENGLDGAVFNSRFHHLRIVWQLLLAPFRQVYELGYLLFKPQNIHAVRMEENIATIGKDYVAQFQWLQDFYLYSAQFFSHVAFAFVIATAALLEFVLLNGWTLRRLTLFVILYLLVGICFTLGRIQFASLFFAENTLAKASTSAKAADSGAA